MALEEGVVFKIEKDGVVIESQVTSACNACKSRKSCLVSTDGRKRYLYIETDLNLKKEDKIQFRIEEKAVLYSSLLLYILPVFTLVLCSLLAGRIHGKLNLSGDAAVAILGGGGFVFSFIVIRFFSIFLGKKKYFKPVFVKKIE